MTSTPDPTALVIVEDRNDGYGTHRYLRPLLTCGHFGDGIFEASSDWNFVDESRTCPTCGQDRQMDLRLQAAVVDNTEIPAEMA